MKLFQIFALLSLPFLSVCCQKENEELTLNIPVATAGNSQTIQLPTSMVTLTGSGTSKNGKIVGYLWSLVSGPNVPLILSPSSATTIINNLTVGSYLFQLMVVDSIGLTGVDTLSISVNPAPAQTLSFQPANNTANELNFAVHNGLNVSSHDIDLDAQAWTKGGTALTARGAFKFDLSAIPANATIVSAKLSLYSNPAPINGDQIVANSGSNNAMYIRRITSNWSGLTATWQTQPSTDLSSQILIPHTNQPFLDLLDIDVKNLVSTMVSTNNYGFMITLQNEVTYTTRQFCSSNHSSAAKRPKLVVVYQ
jgi:hypothetical protein